MTPIGAGERRSRADIQALRGYAVLAVIAFHADAALAPGGFLGVDVFFVVSGYLISGIVMRGRARGAFRFGDFYLRRVRRLAPASAVVLLATIALSVALLTPAAYDHVWRQALGALTFSTNVVLWRQINYFNTMAAIEPLLHLWSLAIEEQYYLLLPPMLALLPRRMWLPTFAAITLASLEGYLWLYPRSPGVAFYLLPTRAWEIGVGSLAACIGPRRWARPAALPAAVILALLPFAPSPLPQHLLAIPACLATAAILLADAEGRRTRRLLAPLARVGDASYALYLVHWPLFAFARTIYLGAALPGAVTLALVAGTFVLGWLLHVRIEEPLRRAPLRPRTIWLAFAASSLTIAALAGAGSLVKRRSPSPLDLGGVTGLGLPGCTGDATAFNGRCTQGATPGLLVWGDSYSQQLLPALEASGTRAVAQASKGQCAPLLGMAPVDDQASEAFARGCLSFNASVVGWLARTPSVSVVVLSGNYARYALPGTHALTDGGVARAELADLVAAQARTTAAVRALGKRVVIVSPPPQAGIDVGQCWERRLTGLPTIVAAPRCAITPATRDPHDSWTRALMQGFARTTPVIRLDAAMCRGDTCATTADGVVLYRDVGHLSQAGSRWLGRRLNLASRVEQQAR